MPAFICVTCGTQFPHTDVPPSSCPICDDERQYVPASGQRWTTLEAMRGSHFTTWRQHEPGLLGIGTAPSFAIGQRALLLRLPGGNVLWDCLSFIDDATVALAKAVGGIRAIAISHPHYYASMVEWADAFGAEIWLHAADREHVVRPSERIRFWSGERMVLAEGVTLINTPSHFAGATMLHWADGAGGAGALLSGDIFQVVPDTRFVSFMRSYPNLIPLPAHVVRAMWAAMEPFAYEHVYGAFWDRVMLRDGKANVARSVGRYLHWISPEARP
ncbi:MAG TPA: MBL fold metallo-hydrolase [Acetobacteraceae bacterium]|jgi:hypothetical protein|nr:MBL fold metallo-hydrolase [Acetobacteraceae bacterium]